MNIHSPPQHKFSLCFLTWLNEGQAPTLWWNGYNQTEQDLSSLHLMVSTHDFTRV